MSSSWIGQAERAAWQRAAAELAAILDAHDDLPLITWTVGPAGSVLARRVSGLFPQRGPGRCSPPGRSGWR